MSRTSRSVAIVLGLMLGVAGQLGGLGAARADSFADRQKTHERVREAFARHAAELQAAFAKAGAAWPPSGMFLRGFKREGVLELWAEKARGSGPKSHERVRVRAFPICAASGILGPKAEAGDGQVPEGFYTIDRFNPRSAYHLSLGLSYPNAVDRARSAGHSPGGDIFIHGNCVTIGCIPIQDDPIEALYVVAVLAKNGGQRALPVHVFPCRFGTDACTTALAEAAPDAELTAFWAVLADGYQRFEQAHIPPTVVVGRRGYAFK